MEVTKEGRVYYIVHYKRTILLSDQAYTWNPEEGLVLSSLSVQVPSLYGSPVMSPKLRRG